MSQLGQLNAELVLKNTDANTKLADLGARQQALEEELARVTSERDVQRAAAEDKLPSCSAFRRRSRIKLGRLRRKALSCSVSAPRSSSRRPSSSTGR